MGRLSLCPTPHHGSHDRPLLVWRHPSRIPNVRTSVVQNHAARGLPVPARDGRSKGFQVRLALTAVVTTLSFQPHPFDRKLYSPLLLQISVAVCLFRNQCWCSGKVYLICQGYSTSHPECISNIRTSVADDIMRLAVLPVPARDGRPAGFVSESNTMVTNVVSNEIAHVL
jgi:hypothetical protein